MSGPSELRLIKECLEYLEKDKHRDIPPGKRGIYVLYKRRWSRPAKGYFFDVVYVGMTISSIRSRIHNHKLKKGDLWTHFSYFEVWDNIQNQEIVELEGLFRHLYRWDSRANSLNAQRGHKPLIRLTKKTASSRREQSSY